MGVWGRGGGWVQGFLGPRGRPWQAAICQVIAATSLVALWKLLPCRGWPWCPAETDWAGLL